MTSFEAGQDERDQLEVLSDRSMPGSRRHSIGGWVLRASRGSTGRANSVWALGDPGVPVGEALDRTEVWYRDQGLVPIFQVFQPVSEDLDEDLNKREYSHKAGAIVMVGSIDALRAESDPYRLKPRPTQCWSEAPPVFADLVNDPERMAEITETDLPQQCVVVSDTEGAPLGAAMSTLDGEWLGLFAMVTVPAARRQGVASFVINELVRRGIDAGASRVWLQVAPDNDGAISLYQRLGMTEAHQYHYRISTHDLG